MRIRQVAVVLAGCRLAAGLALAAQHTEAPKPGPEHQKMGYFIGEWKTEGEMKPSPMGPGGKMTGVGKCKWIAGNFFVLCEDEATSPMGKMSGLGIMGYDMTKKAYTWNGFNSMGQNESATGTISGKVWSYTGEGDMGGKMMKTRYVMTEESPTAYTFKFDMSEDGKTWSEVGSGRSTKK